MAQPRRRRQDGGVTRIRPRLLPLLLLALSACASFGAGPPVPSAQPAAPTAQERREATRLRQEALRALNPPRGAAPDTGRAAALIESAAARGDPDAQLLLALAQLGEGDPGSALPWLHRAAHQGQPDAQYRLARLIEAGEGTRREPAWAAVWFQRAAERGHAQGQFAMGLLQVAGEGTARDEAQALARFELAQRRGVRAAGRYAEALRRRVPAPQARAAAALLNSERARGPVAAVDRPLARFAQSSLAALGRWSGTVDGRDGPATRRALAAFARQEGLSGANPYDPAVLDRLRAAVLPR